MTPLFYKQFLDILAGTTEPINDSARQLVRILLYIGGVNVVMWLMYRIATFTNNHFQPRMFADLSNTCFEYLHKHSFGFFTNRFVGALVKRVSRLVAAFEDICDMFFWG